MPTPAQIISAVSALQNDTAQQRYTNVTCLPYLNLALDILQEIFELNSLPITNETSSPVITVPSGTSINTFVNQNTTPALPADLIEIQQLWESPTGLNQWTPMTKKEFIPHYLEDGTQISRFLIWAWEKGSIVLLTANADNDLRMDYTASMFTTPILISAIDDDLQFTNIKTYLEFETAALCAMFIGEDEKRSLMLSGLAADALSRALGIPIKGMQSITTRRRPFRSGWKRRGRNY